MGITAKRLLSFAFFAIGWLVAGVRLSLDLIGWSTSPEDSSVAMSRAMQILDWLASLPAWMPYGVATALTMWLMYISWPRTAASNAMGGVETSDRADPLAAPGNEKRSLSPAQKHKISELLRGQLPKESKLNIACFGREECIDFAQDFSAAINAAGYESKVVYGGFIGGPTDPNARDLEIIFGPLAYKGLVCSLSDLLTAFSVKHQLLEEEENARMPFRIVVNRPS